MIESRNRTKSFTSGFAKTAFAPSATSGQRTTDHSCPQVRDDRLACGEVLDAPSLHIYDKSLRPSTADGSLDLDISSYQLLATHVTDENIWTLCIDACPCRSFTCCSPIPAANAGLDHEITRVFLHKILAKLHSIRCSLVGRSTAFIP